MYKFACFLGCILTIFVANHCNATYVQILSGSSPEYYCYDESEMATKLPLITVSGCAMMLSRDIMVDYKTEKKQYLEISGDLTFPLYVSQQYSNGEEFVLNKDENINSILKIMERVIVKSAAGSNNSSNHIKRKIENIQMLIKAFYGINVVNEMPPLGIFDPVEYFIKGDHYPGQLWLLNLNDSHKKKEEYWDFIIVYFGDNIYALLSDQTLSFFDNERVSVLLKMGFSNGGSFLDVDFQIKNHLDSNGFNSYLKWNMLIAIGGASIVFNTWLYRSVKKRFNKLYDEYNSVKSDLSKKQLKSPENNKSRRASDDKLKGGQSKSDRDFCQASCGIKSDKKNSTSIITSRYSRLNSELTEKSKVKSTEQLNEAQANATSDFSGEVDSILLMLKGFLKNTSNSNIVYEVCSLMKLYDHKLVEQGINQLDKSECVAFKILFSSFEKILEKNTNNEITGVSDDDFVNAKFAEMRENKRLIKKINEFLEKRMKGFSVL